MAPTYSKQCSSDLQQSLSAVLPQWPSVVHIVDVKMGREVEAVQHGLPTGVHPARKGTKHSKKSDGTGIHMLGTHPGPSVIRPCSTHGVLPAGLPACMRCTSPACRPARAGRTAGGSPEGAHAAVVDVKRAEGGRRQAERDAEMRAQDALVRDEQVHASLCLQHLCACAEQPSRTPSASGL